MVFHICTIIPWVWVICELRVASSFCELQVAGELFVQASKAICYLQLTKYQLKTHTPTPNFLRNSQHTNQLASSRETQQLTHQLATAA